MMLLTDVSCFYNRAEAQSLSLLKTCSLHAVCSPNCKAAASNLKQVRFVFSVSSADEVFALDCVQFPRPPISLMSDVAPWSCQKLNPNLFAKYGGDLSR